jgi:UDP-N-acetylglucosamine 2-epimerase (non-hydrolysing)
MAPVIRECHRREELIDSVVCSTGQHRELLGAMIEYFGLHVDIDLGLMQPGQELAATTARVLTELDGVIVRVQPDCVVAQGDTTTVLGAGLAAFYRHVPFVHVEAGLRTGDLQSPWPEEMNRRVATLAATLHCAPTERAAESLRTEGIPTDRIHVTGNTVIDALHWTLERERGPESAWSQKYAWLDDRRMVLVTGHRRENFGSGLRQICQALAKLAEKFPEVDFVYPVHLNPKIAEPVREYLSGRTNLHLPTPATYPEFVWLMDRASLILTDSGGVQEEAPTLGKPVLVMRDKTERPEAVAAGVAELVGTDAARIVERATAHLTGIGKYAGGQVGNPFGDGHAAVRIVDLLLEKFARNS